MSKLAVNTKEDLNVLNQHLSEPNTHVFVLVFMEECGPCKATRPEWDKIEVADKNKNVVVADVNSRLLLDDSNKIEHVGDVMAYPTIKHVHKGKVHDYSGADRSHASFEKWIKDASASASPNKSQSKVGGRKRRNIKTRRSGKRRTKRNAKKSEKRVRKGCEKKSVKRNAKMQK
jgi:thiol-disulfide isomerase/thioredoxin